MIVHKRKGMQFVAALPSQANVVRYGDRLVIASPYRPPMIVGTGNAGLLIDTAPLQPFSDPDGWLARACREAKEEMATWPEWLR